MIFFGSLRACCILFIGLYGVVLSESPQGRVKEVSGYVNISDSPENRILVSLILENSGKNSIKLPTKREGGASEVIPRRVEKGILYLVNMWGTEYALAGSKGAVPIKQPSGKIGEVVLAPNEFVRLEPISLDLKWARKNQIKKVVYEYISNPSDDSPNGIWSGTVKVEFDLEEVLSRRGVD